MVKSRLNIFSALDFSNSSKRTTKILLLMVKNYCSKWNNHLARPEVQRLQSLQLESVGQTRFEDHLILSCQFEWTKKTTRRLSSGITSKQIGAWTGHISQNLFASSTVQNSMLGWGATNSGKSRVWKGRTNKVPRRPRQGRAEANSQRPRFSQNKRDITFQNWKQEFCSISWITLKIVD